MKQLEKSRVGRASALAFGVALVGGGLVALSPASPALAGPVPMCTGAIGWSGGNAQCTVPAGVSTLTVTAVGSITLRFEMSGGANQPLQATAAPRGN
ncbi:MAG: hypothetical protein WCI74_13935 [Actinomycetes bacterium]